MVIRILLADDHSLMRQGLKQLLEMEGDLRVIGEAGTGEETLDKARQLLPDIILLDINLPDMSGLEVLKKLQDTACPAKVIMLTIHDDFEYVRQTVNLGAKGYLLKDSEAQNLYKAIRDVFEGKTYIHPNLAWQVIAQNEKNHNVDKLTCREREVLALICKGYNNSDIAQKLVISEKTVRNHVSNIYRKLQVKDRTQAVLLGMKSKIIHKFN